MKTGWVKSLVVVGCLILVSALSMGPSCPKDDSNNNKGPSFTIDMSGGNGANGSGGDGDQLYIDSYGIGGAQFGINRPIPSAFAMPAEPKPAFGETLVIINRNTTVDVYVNAAAANADALLLDGDLFLLLGNYGLWVRDSVGGNYVASGLQVNKGATLTLGLNISDGGNAGEDGAEIDCAYDIYVAGVVTTKSLDTGNVGGAIEAGATDRDRGWLELYSSLNVFLAGSGRIMNNGDDATVTNDRGGNGGAVYLYGYSGTFLHGLVDATGGNGLGTGDGGDGACYLGSPDDIYPETSDGYVVNTGTLNASGGNGANGGDAGEVYIYGDTFIFNTGRLMSNGGEGLAGDGGDGDEVYLYSYYASTLNRGRLESNGGDGTSDGGDAGDLYIYSASGGYVAQLITVAPLSFVGGNGANGFGGDGGYMYMENYGGDMIVKGPIIANGGEGETGDGGDGGDLYLYQYSGTDYNYGEDIQPGDIFVAGNINIAGGDGSVNGGGGGYIYAYNTDYDDDDSNYPDFGVYFVGYDRVLANGGDGGNGNGGGGGEVYFETYGSWYADDYNVSPAGRIIFKSRFEGFGGDAENGTGGAGGYVYLNNDDYYYEGKSDAMLIGSCDLHGGDGDLGGGAGGYLDIFGYDGVRVSGAMNLDGGDGTLNNANGGEAGYTDIATTSGDIIMSGSVSGNGGDASGSGTGGGGLDDMEVYAGGQVRSTMSVISSGGDSPTGTGGEGGEIDLFSGTDRTIFNRNMRTIGGEGATDGYEGQVWIDWVIFNGVP